MSHANTPHVYKAVSGGSRHKAPMKAGLLVLIGVVVIAALASALFVVLHHQSSDTTGAKAKPAAADNTSPGTNTDQQNIVASKTPPVTNSVLITESFAGVGQYLASPAGATLYTYSNDAAGTSNCTSSCLSTWPAYEATSTSGLPNDVSTIKRSDTGKLQYTYKGKPLYFFAQDAANGGGVNGDGLNDFHVAKP